MPVRLELDPSRGPLSRPSAEQIARETRNACAVQEAERAWRRSVRRAVVAGFGGLVLANLVGLAGMAVGDDQLGWVLIYAGEAGVVLFPFAVLVLWVVEAHRRGDL
jgi:hypothetical protein